MKLQDVNEVVDKLLETYEGAKAHNLEGYVQVLWNPDDEHYFRITFEKEKSGGYIANVFYKTFLGNVRTKINKRIELEACMSIEKGGTDMKFKVNQKVKTVFGEGKIVFISERGVYLVKIEGHDGHGGGGISHNWTNPDGKYDKLWVSEKELKALNRLTGPQIITNNPATVILWENGDKTVVKCMEGDTYNELFGIALATLKYQLGNNQEAGRKAYELLTSTLAQAKEFKIPDTIMEKFTNNKLAIMVDNQEEWETLLKYLEKKGFVWNSGHLPTKYGRKHEPRMSGVVSDWTQNRFGMTSGKNSKEKITFKQIKGGLK